MKGASGTWIDGVPGDTIPVDDRALQYGDGLFETVLVRRGVARFLDLHLARLARGCARLAIPFEEAVLRAEVGAAVASASELSVLKILVTRGSSTRRGYAPTGDERSRRIVSLHAASLLSPEEGVDLGVASFRIADGSPLAGLKHLNRLENVLAAREAKASGVFDVLLATADRVISGSMCNLFVVRAGRVTTPATDGAGVAGVMRAVVLRECERLGLAATEARVTMEDMHRADEAFVTNARIGVVPVRRVGEHRFTKKAVGLKLAGHVEGLDA